MKITATFAFLFNAVICIKMPTNSTFTVRVHTSSKQYHVLLKYISVDIHDICITN